MLPRFGSMPGCRKRVRSFSATPVCPSQPQVDFRAGMVQRNRFLKRLGSLLVVRQTVVVPPHQIVHSGVFFGNRLQNFKRFVELREVIELARVIQPGISRPKRRRNAQQYKRQTAHPIAFSLELPHISSPTWMITRGPAFQMVGGATCFSPGVPYFGCRARLAAMDFKTSVSNTV